MESMGPELKESIAAAKTLALAKCGHEESPVSATECLRSLVGDSNHEHYWVATQDRALRAALQDIAGAPSLLLTPHGLTLETPSDLHKVRLQASLNPRFLLTIAVPICVPRMSCISCRLTLAGRGREAAEGSKIRIRAREEERLSAGGTQAPSHKGVQHVNGKAKRPEGGERGGSCREVRSHVSKSFMPGRSEVEEGTTWRPESVLQVEVHCVEWPPCGNSGSWQSGQGHSRRVFNTFIAAAVAVALWAAHWTTSRSS